MSWTEIQKFLDEGGSGPDVIAVVEKLRSDANLRRTLRQEILLTFGVTAQQTGFVVDLYMLDDFLNGVVKMPQRAQLLSAVCQDESLWLQLKQLFKAQQAAEEFGEPRNGNPPSGEVMESGPEYRTGAEQAVIPILSLRADQSHWRLQEQNPNYDYEIRQRPAARLGHGSHGFETVDEAVIRNGEVSCAVAFSPRLKRLELQISNCPAEEQDFKEAVLFLRRDNTVLLPASREFSGRNMCQIIFEEVDPSKKYILEIASCLISR